MPACQDDYVEMRREVENRMRRTLRTSLLAMIFTVVTFAFIGCTTDSDDATGSPDSTSAPTSTESTSTSADDSTGTSTVSSTTAVSPMSELDVLPDIVDEVINSVVLVESIDGASAGSGIVLDVDGHILTNYHVVEAMGRIKVTLYDGSASEAEIVGSDPSNDLAVIHAAGFSADQLQPATLGDSSTVRIGQRVFAIGNPFSERFTVTQGIISALNRSSSSFGGRSIQGVLQTDAALNPGNSGGPLFNLSGEVVGINTSIRNPQGQSFAGLGFAVPSNTAKRHLGQLIAGETIEHAQLGVGGPVRLDEVSAPELGVTETRGLYLTTILPGGAAQLAGMMPGDILVELNGQQTYTFEQLARVVESASVGETIEAVLIRDGERMTLMVELLPWSVS